MEDEYQIVSVARGARTQREPMGSKEKFWVAGPGEHKWLFKLPTRDTGGHWAEKIAYEIACRSGIDAAEVELAECSTPEGRVERGSICRSFPMEDELYHGNQILAGMDPGYASDKKYSQNQHTVDRIMDSMNIFPNVDFANGARARLAGYLVLDAVIGNVDRHHENWGILRRVVDGKWQGRLAPTFDHASSLGRELRDSGSRKSRERFLDELGVDHYARRATGAIFIAESGSRGPSPLELVRWCVASSAYESFFRDACRRVARLSTSVISRAVTRVPNGWMTPTAEKFAIKLLRHNRAQIRKIVE